MWAILCHCREAVKSHECTGSCSYCILVSRNFCIQRTTQQKSQPCPAWNYSSIKYKPINSSLTVSISHLYCLPSQERDRRWCNHETPISWKEMYHLWLLSALVENLLTRLSFSGNKMMWCSIAQADYIWKKTCIWCHWFRHQSRRWYGARHTVFPILVLDGTDDVNILHTQVMLRFIDY